MVHEMCDHCYSEMHGVCPGCEEKDQIIDALLAVLKLIIPAFDNSLQQSVAGYQRAAKAIEAVEAVIQDVNGTNGMDGTNGIRTESS